MNKKIVWRNRNNMKKHQQLIYLVCEKLVLVQFYHSCITIDNKTPTFYVIFNGISSSYRVIIFCIFLGQTKKAIQNVKEFHSAHFSGFIRFGRFSNSYHTNLVTMSSIKLSKTKWQKNKKKKANKQFFFCRDHSLKCRWNG